LHLFNIFKRVIKKKDNNDIQNYFKIKSYLNNIELEK